MGGRIVISILSLLIWACERSDGQSMQLVAGHVLFRHGDRTPITTFPTDPIKETDWPNGFGQLTVAGVEQHHRLGGYLRTRYGSLLNSTYVASELRVRSTDYDRTLMSAQSNLVGLYPVRSDSPTGQVPIQPIPIHTIPITEDFLLAVNDCPRYDQIEAEIQNSDDVRKIDEYYQGFFENLQAWTQLKKITVYNAWDIADTIYVESVYNRTPAWANEGVKKNLSEINDLSYQTTFSNDESRRIRGGPWVQDVWMNINRSARGETFFKVKVYSAHDTTVSAVLSFLGINYPHQPSYASAVFVDLYKQNSNYFVRVEYLNVTDSNTSYPYVLKGCPSTDCPWETFTQIYQARFPASAEVECAAKFSPFHPSSRMGKVLVIGLVLLIGVLFVLAVIFVPTYLRRRTGEPLLLATESGSQIS